MKKLLLPRNPSSAKGDYLCEGDISAELYVLINGSADIIKDNDGNDHLINQVGPMETLGEMGMMDELPRSASIRISSDMADVAVVWGKQLSILLKKIQLFSKP